MASKDHKRLGEMLIEAKLIKPEDLEQAISEQRRTGRLLGATLIGMGLISEDQVLQVLQRQLGTPLVDLTDIVVDDQALARIKEDIAKKYGALPIEIDGRSTLVVAMADPLNVAALEDLRFCVRHVHPAGAREHRADLRGDRALLPHRSFDRRSDRDADQQGRRGHRQSRRRQRAGPRRSTSCGTKSEGRPIVRLTNWILHRAVEARASDIHIEPQDKELVVRFRIDGLLQEVQRLPQVDAERAGVAHQGAARTSTSPRSALPQDGRLTVEMRRPPRRHARLDAADRPTARRS